MTFRTSQRLLNMINRIYNVLEDVIKRLSDVAVQQQVDQGRIDACLGSVANLTSALVRVEPVIERLDQHYKLGHADAHESDMTEAQARKILAEGEPCEWCGRHHVAMKGCTCVAEMTMDVNGRVTHVVFRPQGTWRPLGLSVDDLARVIARAEERKNAPAE